MREFTIATSIGQHMHRRNVIQIAALGIIPFSGCLTKTFSSSSQMNDQHNFPNISISNSTIDIPNTRFQASVVKQFASDHPARIKVIFENTGSERTFSFGSSPPFSSYWGTHETENSTLILVPKNREYIRAKGNSEGDSSLIPSAPIDGCWKMKTTLFRQDIGQELTVGSGQKIQEEYALLNVTGNKNCLPTGSYHFTQQNSRRELILQVYEGDGG